VGLTVLWQARALVLTLFIGLLFGLAAIPAVDWLEARRIRRGIGAAAVLFGGAALVASPILASTPTILRQSVELKTKLPEAVGKLEGWLGQRQPALLDILAPPDGRAPLPAGESRIVHALLGEAGTIKDFAFGVLSSTAAAFAGAVIIVFFAIYVAAEPETYREGFLQLVPPARRPRLREVMSAMARTLRAWLVAQLVAMLAIGLVSMAVFAMLGVRAAVPLGMIAGLFEFIPNVGPTLSAIPAVAMGFVDSPQKALMVLGACWGIQFLENNLLIPYLMKEHLELPPALTLVVQVLMALFFGLLGLFVAVPLLATSVVAIKMLWLAPRDAAAAAAQEAA